MFSTVFASLANAVLFADGSCMLRSALFLSSWRITWLLFAVKEDKIFYASLFLISVLRTTTFIDLEALWREAIPRLYSDPARAR